MGKLLLYNGLVLRTCVPFEPLNLDRYSEKRTWAGITWFGIFLPPQAEICCVSKIVCNQEMEHFQKLIKRLKNEIYPTRLERIRPSVRNFQYNKDMYICNTSILSRYEDQLFVKDRTRRVQPRRLIRLDFVKSGHVFCPYDENVRKKKNHSVVHFLWNLLWPAVIFRLLSIVGSGASHACSSFCILLHS